MSGDYSRYGFDPKRNYSSVLLQQGRPLTDRDWNGQAIGTARRAQAGAFDTLASAPSLAVAPASTPNGFAITFDASGNLQIGQGRLYVDGLMVENHGTGTATWDPALAETFGASPTPYAAQPYLPNPPPLPASGAIAIAYLDVWEREVTQYEDPLLVESALGVDTTTRRETVWQLRFLTGQAAGTTCATPVTFPTPSGGRLSTTPATVPGQTNPCIIPPSAGYAGLENQLYRIEIQQGGAPGTATFKWSRDNASVQARVMSFVDLSHIVVDSVGRDNVLRFSDGDWIEITDDWREFSQQPGELHHITVGGGVDDATRTITLDTPITSGLFPTDAQGNLTTSRNTRIRRWDQQGKILDQNGNLYTDLDAAGSSGAIPVPATSATSVLLENGVLASFSIAASGGAFQAFDYWVFAARANDSSLEMLSAAPPRGIHHHYAKLAVVTFPGTLTGDCRVPWPPAQSGNDCCCTACITPKSHQTGAYTLQKAVDDVSTTGGTVCLAPGAYALTAPVTIASTAALRIVGQGGATVLTTQAGAFVITGGGDIRLESFQITGGQGLAANGASSIRVSQTQTSNLTIDRLGFTLTPTSGTGAAINFGSLPINATVQDSSIVVPSGIVYLPPAQGGASGAVVLVVQDNLFETTLDAVTISGQTATTILLQISRNRITECALWAICLQFPGVPASSVKIEANSIATLGDGILAGAMGVRVLDNDVGFFGPLPVAQDGIVLWSLYTTGPLLADCEIVGNRVAGFPAAGIAIRSPVNRAMIKQNQINTVGAGIALQDTATTVTTPTAAISIENNQITDVGFAAATTAAAQAAVVAGIWVNQAASVHVVGNTILRVGLLLPVAQSRVGIFVTASDRANVSGNEISDVAPQGNFVGSSIGISILTPFGGVDIAGNLVRRFSPALGVTTVDSSDWTPLLVIGPAFPATGTFFAAGTASAGRFNTVFVRTQDPVADKLVKNFKPDAETARADAGALAPRPPLRRTRRLSRGAACPRACSRAGSQATSDPASPFAATEA